MHRGRKPDRGKEGERIDETDERVFVARVWQIESLRRRLFHLWWVVLSSL